MKCKVNADTKNSDCGVKFYMCKIIQVKVIFKNKTKTKTQQKKAHYTYLAKRKAYSKGKNSCYLHQNSCFIHSFGIS